MVCLHRNRGACEQQSSRQPVSDRTACCCLFGHAVMSVTWDMDVNCGTILAVLSMPVTVIIGLCQIPIEYVE